MKDGSGQDHMEDRKALWIPRPIRSIRSPWLVLNHVNSGRQVDWLTYLKKDSNQDNMADHKALWVILGK